MRKMKFVTLAFILLSITFSCTELENGSEATRTKRDKVRIGMVTFPGYAPLYLANEKKLFTDLDVELVRIEAIGDIRAAMNSGNIDIYAATPDIFQTTEYTKPPGIGFMAIDQSNGGDGIVVSKEIASLQDLKGKRVGAEPGLPPYFILQYMLNKAGLTIEDIDFQDIATQDAGNAFVAKQLDIAGVYEPFLSISAEKREGARVLVSSKDTPGLIVDLLFASDKLVTESPEILKRVADGWFKGVGYWQKHPDESMAIMAKSFGVDKAEMMDIKSGVDWLTLEDNRRLFNKNHPNNAFETFTIVGDILEKNNSAKARVSAKDKLTDKIINLF